jgi:hypothetical protein
MSKTATITSLLIAAVVTLGTFSSALADGRHRDGGRHHGRYFDYAAPADYGSAANSGAQIQVTASNVAIAQNGDGNSASVLQQSAGVPTTITQNGNNNSLTVIQIVGGNRGRRDRRARSW